MAKIIMIGATGAVGGHCAKNLIGHSNVELTVLGRRMADSLSAEKCTQFEVDLTDPVSYAHHLANKEIAVCTLGVGQPTKTPKAEFEKIDKDLVLAFGEACRQQGVRDFHLLSSVAADSRSASFFLRIKGELIDALQALEFRRLSIYQPSMILTPTNRYGFSQAVTLAVWAWLDPVLFGHLRKYRGIKVDVLGKAIALNALQPKSAFERLHWDEITAITQ